MYVEMRAVGANPQRATPSETGCGSGVGELETTCQSAGAVTVSWKVALRSGWSKRLEDPHRVARLVLRVEVDGAVDRVGEPVQPLAGARVGDVDAGGLGQGLDQAEEVHRVEVDLAAQVPAGVDLIEVGLWGDPGERGDDGGPGFFGVHSASGWVSRASSAAR